MRTPKRSLLAGTAAAALIVAPVSAMAAPNLQQDDKWLSLSGNVVDVEGSIFTLDYGEGLVTVEMDDWDWYDETGSLMPGESVVVYGEVDNDLFEQATIEASSVYVSNRNT
ncbi:MAG: NirD/YgiW/YdeI family stress tolerance protein, partial [Parvibaculum sp.]|nr:NirD/YgiW/YdeI family stress tolerance protein [Parvibaculum sp.]